MLAGGIVAGHAVSVQSGVELAVHGVFAGESHDQAHGHKQTVEQNEQNTAFQNINYSEADFNKGPDYLIDT